MPVQSWPAMPSLLTVRVSVFSATRSTSVAFDPFDADAHVGGSGGQRAGAGDEQEASEKDGQETTGHV